MWKPGRLATIVLALLLTAPGAAHAATMTLKSVAVDRSGVIEDEEWTAPDGGGSASRVDSATPSTYTVAWAFPVPSAIPAGGATFTIRVKSEARKNGYDQHTRFAPAMRVSGAIVSGGSVSVFADASSDTKPSDEQSANVTLSPIAGASVLRVELSDGPVYSYTFEGAADPPAATPPAACTAHTTVHAAQACVRTARISRVSGEVAVRHGAGGWRALRSGESVDARSELFAGVDSSIEITFADGSKAVLDELTQAHVGTLLFYADHREVELFLEVGRIKANVRKEKVLDTNFEIRTPVATTSARGTRFSVFHDPSSRTTITSAEEGSVAVVPSAAGLATAQVGPGREIQVSARAISPVVAIGLAGARGRVNRVRARSLVLARIARVAKRCGTRASRSIGAVTISPNGRGWGVGVAITGKRSGRSTWRVRGTKAVPVNALARKLAGGCR